MTGRPVRDAVRLHPDDDVATVLRDVRAGETLAVGDGSATLRLACVSDVPACHKVALRPVAAGAAVRKHGETIGVARAAIAEGEHVHVHNLAGTRGVRPPR